MTNHTSGPWRSIDGVERKSVVYTSDVRYCVEVIGPHLTDPERQANARLIAAAPELLAACELLLAVYAPLYSPAEPTDAFGSAVIKARSAIAKATA